MARVDPDSLSPEERDARARKMRMAGAFGYEPQEPIARSAPPREAAAVEAADVDESELVPLDALPDAPGPRRGRRLGDPVEKPRSRLGQPIYGPDDGPDDAEAAGQEPFGPPGPAVPVATGPRVPFGSLVGELIAFPIKNGRGLFMITMAALFPFCFEMLWRAAVGITKIYVIAGGGVALVLLTLYPFAWLVRVAERGTQGGTELPGWPDFTETLGLGWRKVLTDLACIAPAVMVLFCMVYEGSLDYPTIGPQAQMLAGGEEPKKDQSAASVVLLDMDHEEVPLSGKWTVIGLLGRDSGEQVDMSDMNLPSGGMGITIYHGRQIWDLERVGRALGDRAQVLGTWSDPALKKIGAKFPYTRKRWEAATGEGEDDYEDEDVDEDDPLGEGARRSQVEEDLARAMGQAERGMTWDKPLDRGGKSEKLGPDQLRYDEDPFKALKLTTTQELGWPGPFAGTRRLPCVFVIDPSGRIRREYPTGVWDQQLYADVLDLLAGGNGYARAKELPVSTLIFSEPEEALLPPAVSYGFFLILFLAGCFYYPMALLMMVCFNSGAMAFRYPAGLRAISVTIGDYLALAGVFVGVQFFGLMLKGGADFILRNELGLPPIVAGILGDYSHWWITYYGLLVTSYGVGRFYQINAARLGWFTQAEPGDV